VIIYLVNKNSAEVQCIHCDCVVAFIWSRIYYPKNYIASPCRKS